VTGHDPTTLTVRAPHVKRVPTTLSAVIRRSFRIGLWLGLLGGIALAVVKIVQARQPAPSPAPARPDPWPRLETPPAPVNPTPAVTPPSAAVVSAAPAVPAPAAPTAPAPPPVAKKAPAAKKAAAKKAPAKAQATWVDPDGNICPKTHPVKAKLSSKIFQLPGMFAYDRTKPDRCYKNAAGAEGDGFRAAKR